MYPDLPNNQATGLLDEKNEAASKIESYYDELCDRDFTDYNSFEQHLVAQHAECFCNISKQYEGSDFSTVQNSIYSTKNETLRLEKSKTGPAKYTRKKYSCDFCSIQLDLKSLKQHYKSKHGECFCSFEKFK